jgi:hypothetical protein
MLMKRDLFDFILVITIYSIVIIGTFLVLLYNILIHTIMIA